MEVYDKVATTHKGWRIEICFKYRHKGKEGNNECVLECSTNSFLTHFKLNI
jgi:hypothetical protein